MGAHVDIPSVLQRLGIEAKRRGKEWFALCPNPAHDDRSPSWRIRDEPGGAKHGYMNCYPCGFHGTVVDLVAAVFRIEKREARAWLEDGAAVDNRPVASAVEMRIQKWRTGFRLPVGVTEGPLAAWPSTPRRYAEERGILSWQVETWGIGYAVEGKLAGRIVFVKRKPDRTPVGYSARTYTNDRRRYLEPEPKEGASPAAVFGEQWWPESRSGRTVHVVEGAINALAVERAHPGYYVAATSGSQLHPLVAAKLATFGEVVAVTDPDEAGDKLAAALASALARHGTRIRRVRLPAGQDAASVTRTELQEALG